MLSPHLLDLLRELGRLFAHWRPVLGPLAAALLIVQLRSVTAAASAVRVGCLAGWLGREDSNLCISNWCPAVFSAVVPCGEGRSCTRLLESIGRHPCRRTVA
jgi:hypothetical protein